ncbi:SdpI family protein [Chitinophaga parva]|nr:SdpI family protein [Chitinophaga parva]
MKQSDFPKEVLIILLLLVPMAYLGIIWPTIPEMVGTNYTVQGTPGRIGDKNELLLLMIFLFLTNFLLYCLFRYIPKTDEVPDHTSGYWRSYYRTRFLMHLYLAVFTSVLIFMIHIGKEFLLERWAFVGVGLLVVILGVYLGGLQPNYFIGVRTPWTLMSSQIWQETHRMASRLWIIAGIVIMSCGFFMQAVSAVFVVIVIAALIAFLPYIYSFRLYNTDKG